MLRRAPTTITLTSSDLELYEANRQRKTWEKQQQQQLKQQGLQSDSSSDKATDQRDTKLTQKDRIMGGQRQGRGH